jgi:hypothetical protein
MAIGSVCTLFVVPAFYVLLARDHSLDQPTDSTSTVVPAPSH